MSDLAAPLLGLKLLADDGSSLNGRMVYNLNGDWQDVPGSGA